VILVSIVLFPFFWATFAAPSSLRLPSPLRCYSAPSALISFTFRELLSLGALDFGMVVDGSVVMIENIVRHHERHSESSASESACHFRGDEVTDMFSIMTTSRQQPFRNPVRPVKQVRGNVNEIKADGRE